MKREIKNLNKPDKIHLYMNVRGDIADRTKEHNITEDAMTEVLEEILNDRKITKERREILEKKLAFKQAIRDMIDEPNVEGVSYGQFAEMFSELHKEFKKKAEDERKIDLDKNSLPNWE